MAVPDNPFVNRVRHGLEYLGLGRHLAPFPIRREARPWTQRDIRVDGGLEILAPDYVGIGTQKSGTSWWAGLIEQHPDVAPNWFKRKEMHYLAHFLERAMTNEEIETYHAAFARPSGKKCGEWTPNYMANPFTMPRLREAAPQARLLVMLRHPVDRFESGFNHELKQRFGGVIGPSVRMEVIKHYALRTESVWHGMYGAQLGIVFDTFPRERILVMQYEQCRANPGEWIRKTYRFLGLDEEFQPQGITKTVNEQRRVAGRLSADARQALTDTYRDDVRRLKTLCPDAIDLSLWAGFEDTC